MTVVLIALLCLWIGAIVLAGRFFLWPSREPIPHAASERMIDGIQVLIAGAAEPDAYILRFYGNADRAERWVDHEVRPGVQMWAVNFPGFGKSEGSASLAGVARAADVAAKAIFSEAKGKPVLVYGTSMGTTAALRIAATHPVAGVFIHNPPPLPQMVRGELGWWNLWLIALPVSWLIPSALDSIHNARLSKAPAFFVHSGEDEVVPEKYQLLISEAYAGPKGVTRRPHAHHNDGLDAETTDAAEQWRMSLYR